MEGVSICEIATVLNRFMEKDRVYHTNTCSFLIKEANVDDCIIYFMAFTPDGDEVKVNFHKSGLLCEYCKESRIYNTYHFDQEVVFSAFVSAYDST